jgi:hypothetical protein
MALALARRHRLLRGLRSINVPAGAGYAVGVRNWDCKQSDRGQKQPSNLSFHEILLEWIGPAFLGSAAKLIERSLFESAGANLLRIRSRAFPEARLAGSQLRGKKMVSCLFEQSVTKPGRKSSFGKALTGWGFSSPD